MSIDTTISNQVMAKMQEAADKAATGMRERDEMRDALAEMSRLRELLRQRIGTVDVAVGLIRDARDQ